MKKYRKKPLVIEALQWTGYNYKDVQEFTSNKATYYEWFQHNESGTNKEILQIPTSEGVINAFIGDFIIKEVFDKKRGFYPCKPDIFEQTYEECE